MKVLRIILGVLIVLWALMGAFSMGGMWLYKLNPGGDVPDYAERMIPLVEAMPLWMFAAWLVFWLFLLASAWRLLRGGHAFVLFLIAFAGNILGWWLMSRLPSYGQVFTPAELMADYYILAGMAVVAALIWLSERSGRFRNSANAAGAGAYATPSHWGAGDHGSSHSDSGGSDGGGGGD